MRCFKRSYFLLLLAAACFSACKTLFFAPAKNTQTTFSKTLWLENFRPYESLLSRYQIQWQQEEERRTFHAHLTLQEGEKLLLGLQKSGFPFFKLLASNHKISAVNYLNDEFFEDTKTEDFPLTIGEIENLFLARIDTALLDQITYDNSEHLFVLKEKKQVLDQDIQKTAWIHPKLYVLERVLLQTKDWQITLQYEYPKRNKKDFLLPQRIQIAYQSTKKTNQKQSFSLKLTQLNLSPNSGRFKLKIPDYYQKVDSLQQLLR